MSLPSQVILHPRGSVAPPQGPSPTGRRKRQEPPTRARAVHCHPGTPGVRNLASCPVPGSCVQLFVVSTSAAPDSKASRDPSPAELISFRYQAGSPATPPKEITMPRESSRTRPATPTRLPAPDGAAMASPAPGSADLVPRRKPEKSVSWSGRERLRCLRHRLRLTVAEMNYATRRTGRAASALDLQGPPQPLTRRRTKRGELMPAHMPATTGSPALPGKLP